MRGSIHRRWTAWLALVAAALLGVAPSGGLVLCLEPDGTIALESAGAGRACGGCDELTGDAASARVVSPASECCACLDIPVEGHGDEARAPLASFELHIDLPLALAPECSASRPDVIFERVRACRGGPPGPPGALAHIRTVVLRV